MSQDHSCCLSGHIHEGKDTGIEEKFAGVNTYVAKAANASGKAVLFLSDVFGVPFINNRLLCDVFAKESGADVYLPDLFDGDVVSTDILKGKMPEGFTFDAWKSKHTKEIVRPIFLAVIKDLKERHGVTNIVSIGFCYGGWASLELAASDLVDGAVMVHPSLIEIELKEGKELKDVKDGSDIKDIKDIANIKKPSLFLLAEVDNNFPTVPTIQRSEEIIKEKGIHNVEFKTYPGVHHGFAIRGLTAVKDLPKDADDKEAEKKAQAAQFQQKAAEQAKDDAVAYFKKVLNIH
eukprot:TRINITY_DN639_c0_g1_i1.p1 TRINITY_DN639_c0_g1~~TRINITY_DN639_c0_g1_i1.p1  ORF type:complete len:291 (-),score=64.29 TRINITY_DN639_c0_g1_i1:211-1083(-)